MPVLLAYVAVIVVWSTTPLGVKWSGDGISPLIGAAGRMAIAAVFAALLLKLFKIKLRWDRKSIQAFLAANLGWSVGMICVYVAAKSLPSGVISVIFGLSPLLTALLARYVLPGETLLPLQWGAIAIGFLGMVVVFHDQINVAGQSLTALFLTFFSVLMFSLSTLLVKRIDARLHPLAQTTGSLLVALPFYTVIALIFAEGALNPTPKAIGAIVYLGIVGSLVGFVCYFYVLEKMPATKVSMIPMMTPVFALLLGNVLNNEAVSPALLLGGAVIITALCLFEFANRLPVQTRSV